MRLLFSELDPDYSRYTYPYVVWAMPEAGETAADLFDAGFLPASPGLERFYLCRHLRVPLAGFVASSENRRVLRRGAAEGWVCELTPRASFDYTSERRSAWLGYAAERFGEGIMHERRLDTLMSSPVISHLLVFREEGTGRELGTVLLYLEGVRLAYYYYAFYDPGLVKRGLGMFMMTTAVGWFAARGVARIYLGTCYSERALYKTQFGGVEFFNGREWGTDLAELKLMVRREAAGVHLLQDPVYLEKLGGVQQACGVGGFPVQAAARDDQRLREAGP